MSLILPTITAPSETVQAVLDRIDEGLELHEKGDIWGAEKVYRRVLKDYPGQPKATALMGLLAHVHGENDRALKLLDTAAEDDPNSAFINGNRGAILFSLGRHADAIEAYTQAVEAWPGYAVGYANLAVALAEMFRHEEAAYAVTRAVELDPHHYDYGYLRPYLLDLTPSTTPACSLDARRRFNDQHIAPRMVGRLLPENDRTPERKLKVGYVSSDFYQHSAVHAFGGILLNHDPERVDVTLYGSVENADDITKQLQAKLAYVDVRGWSEDKLALKVRKDQIDVLVDLSTFTKGNHLRAFARKPAPVQVSGWGYAAGTGLDCMDAFMGDAVISPAGDAWRYTERVVQLPCAMSWTKPNYLIDAGHVPSVFGRPFTYLVANRLQKLTRSSIDAWCEILRLAPNTRLIIKSPGLDSQQAKDALTAIFKRAGVFYADGPNDAQGRRPTRVALFGKTSHADQLSAHWRADVMLDTWPMTGGVSAIEALWMGVPIVTLCGDRAVGRITTSIMQSVGGLDDWITHSWDAYIQRAVDAAQRPYDLIPLRRELRDRLMASPVAQLQEYARTVEDAYDMLWRQWCESPEQAQEGKAA